MKHIYLNGVVVDNWDQLMEMGMSDFSFIELTSIQNEFKNLGEEKEVMLHVNSRGGSVDAGNKIYDFLRLQEIENGITINTRADGDCASIASKIFLVAKKENRSITSHASVMIHLPWLEMGGNSDDLRNMASELDILNNDFARFYSERTGMNEATALQYMKDETTFTADECISLGIAGTKIETIKAFAFSHIKSKNQTKSKMEKSKKLKDVISFAKNLLGIMNADLTGVDGTRLDFEGDEIAIGVTVEVTQNDAVVELFSGEVTLEDGRVIVIADNVVTDITEAVVAEDVEALKTKIADLERENGELKALTEEATTVINAFSKGVGKSLNLKGKDTVFAKVDKEVIENRVTGYKSKMK